VRRKIDLFRQLDLEEIRSKSKHFATLPIYSGMIDISELQIDPSNRKLFKFHIARLVNSFEDGLDFDNHPPIVVSIPESKFAELYPLCISGNPFCGDIIVDFTFILTKRMVIIASLLLRKGLIENLTSKLTSTLNLKAALQKLNCKTEII